METTTVLLSFLMGFTGSLHCAGMCGPIVWVMPFQQFGGWQKAAALALYHTGRITVYATLAIALHSFRHLFSPHIQQYVSIGLGVVLLVAGILSFFPQLMSTIQLPWGDFVKKQLGRVIGKPTLGAITLAGILNGLLPCGLVYMALSASLTQPTALRSAGMIYMFGLGTIPMLASISLLKTRLSILRGPNIRKLVPVAVFAFGCIFVLRGLNLGIPYLSPKIEVTQKEIRAACCHKK